LGGIAGFGTVKATGLQLHTIRQVSKINAPNLTGVDGDLVIDSGVTTRANNGHLKIKGGYEGASKIDVLETGVWDKDTNVGLLTNSDVTATTLNEHLSVGTLLTGVKVPIMGSSSMDASKVYALRNVGTDGHVAWASINDIGGDLKVSGKLSVSADTFLSKDLSVGGDTTMDGNINLGQALSVGANAQVDGSLSIGGRFDLQNQIVVGGISIFRSSLSVATEATVSDSLSVGAALVADNARLTTSLVVGDLAQFDSNLSLAGDARMTDLYVQGRIFPFSNGLSVGGDVLLADSLSVGDAITGSGSLTVAGAAVFDGATFDLNAANNINLGQATTAVGITAQTLRADAPLKLIGHLSVGNSSAVLMDTPLLSVQGSIFTDSDATFRGKLNLTDALSCGTSAFLGSSLHVGTNAAVASDVTVGAHLSVAGAVTIMGDLNVEGTTTTISSTTLTVQDKTLELGVVDNPSDSLATGSGVIIKGSSDKTFLYTRSPLASATNQQLSAFTISEDLVLGKKTTVFSDTLTSRLTDSPRSQVLHLGDMSSTDGHWMIVSNISDGKLQFWYGQDIADDQTMDAMPTASAKLAFEIQKPT
jgi:predicted acyltransferase (DUF342 family)